MISIITSMLPILLGFVAKLVALKSQAAAEQQKLMIDRRFIIVVILSLIIFTQVAPVFLDVPTVIPTVVKGFSFFGLQLTPDVVEYVTVDGMLKFDEIFKWAAMIIEFYFGAQLAKGK